RALQCWWRVRSRLPLRGSAGMAAQAASPGFPFHPRAWGAGNRRPQDSGVWTGGQPEMLWLARNPVASGAVPRGEVVRALHLDQPRGRALERGRVALAGVQQRRRRIGRADQVDLAVVELVAQVDEAARGVVAALVEHRDPAQQHGVELACDLDVVGGAARTPAPRIEIVPGHAPAAP